jgi:uncharacterized protein
VSRRALLAAALGASIVAGAASAQEPGPTEPFLVVTKKAVVELSLELALQPEQQQKGLMFRRSLADHSGMLFDFGGTGPVYMWMKNTYIPLDMLFVDEAGRIVHIAHRTKRESTDTISAGREVRGVIEIAGGAADTLGIAEGDLVAKPVFDKR